MRPRKQEVSAMGTMAVISTSRIPRLSELGPGECTKRCRAHVGMVSLLFVSVTGATMPAAAEARAGTTSVAQAGSTVQQQESWAEGVAEFLNDPARTNGWNDWFSEWPNDVNHYELHPATMDDVNKLIARFRRIKSDDLQLFLSPLAEPAGYGWVSSLPEGNAVPMMFTIGNQRRIDDWFAQLPDSRFGVMQFEETPVAVPPSLTLFVGNPLIDLDELVVPAGIDVQAGYLPRVFHKWNTKPKAPSANERRPAKSTEPVDPELQQRIDAIATFIRQRMPPE